MTVPEKSWIDCGVRAIEQAGTLLRTFTTEMRRTERIEEGGRETKIKADAALHDQITADLTSTGLPILSEEGETGLPDPDCWCWIVDPLDGSANFQRGFTLCGISIALCRGLDPAAGFLFDVHTGRTYCGGKQQETEPAIRCATTQTIDRAIICTGIPARLQIDAAAQNDFLQIFTHFYKVRMLGSAVQALLHVALGKADVYFEREIMFWDIAAGLALVEAAGGKVIRQPGTKPGRYRCLACAPHLAPAVEALLLP